jgi:hypothetical protein
MAWYLNRALSGFRRAVDAAYPRRDRTSDGTIGDAAHQGTNSDHNPDPDGSVDAWDMDVNLRSANDGAAIENLKRVFQAHPSSRYWIHNRQEASRSNGWRRVRYTGSNPHTQHVHWNSREGYEDSTAPWPVEGADMPITPAEAKAIADEVLYRDVDPTSVNVPLWQAVNRARIAAEAANRKADEILARLDSVSAGGGSAGGGSAGGVPAGGISDEQLERVLRKVLSETGTE